jgi:hypothetical protein
MSASPESLFSHVQCTDGASGVFRVSAANEVSSTSSTDTGMTSRSKADLNALILKILHGLLGDRVPTHHSDPLLINLLSIIREARIPEFKFTGDDLQSLKRKLLAWINSRVETNVGGAPKPLAGRKLSRVKLYGFAQVAVENAWRNDVRPLVLELLDREDVQESFRQFGVNEDRRVALRRRAESVQSSSPHHHEYLQDLKAIQKDPLINKADTSPRDPGTGAGTKAVSDPIVPHEVAPKSKERERNDGTLIESLRLRFPDAFYRHRDGSWADAICLEGAAGQTFPANQLQVSMVADYEMPPALLEERHVHGERVIKEWEAILEYKLEDKPCIGLESYKWSRRKEKIHLDLRLTRMTWFDYVFTNQRFGEPKLAALFPTHREVGDFVIFDHLVEHRDLKASRLSHILPVYVTCSTSDGYVLYSKRSHDVGSDQDLLISAVSENIDIVDDRVFEDKELSLFNTAARGIGRELSWDLEPPDPGSNIQLIGMDFDLGKYHPGLLFYIALPFTRTEVEQRVTSRRGDEHKERKGPPRFTHLGDRAGISAMLNGERWFASGKACMMRTLEFLAFKAKQGRCTLIEAASRLAAWQPSSAAE